MIEQPIKFMTDEEKGYHCPDGPCNECPYLKTLCIVHSSAGRKKYKEWEKMQKKNILFGD